MDPDDRQPVSGGALRVLLDDLVRYAHQRAAQIVAVEDDFLAHARPFLVSRDRVKGTTRSP